MTDNLYDAALKHYQNKNQRVQDKALPIITEIKKNRGATIQDIMVPFTDGKKQIGVVTSLEKAVDTDCRELVNSMEKITTLALIDQAWKEHLREMDDLKQSVQSAVYEQKDPLLIYKFEAFELFKRFIAKVNEDTVSFLIKADLPVQQPDEVREAHHPTSKQQLQESKEESRSLLAAKGAGGNRPPVEKHEPVKSQKVASRNQRVSVQYMDGSIKKNVKYKIVEEDLIANKCVIVED